MKITYQYRLRLTTDQQDTVDEWLELCRRQYNYRLAERFNWYDQNRCDINACLLICHLPELNDTASVPILSVSGMGKESGAMERSGVTN